MTSLRLLSDVSQYLPATLQVRLKSSTQRHCKEVSVLRLHDFTLKLRDNVSSGCNINVSSQVSTRSQKVSNETINSNSVVHHLYVSAVPIHDFPLVSLYNAPFKSQMKHPMTLLWYVFTTGQRDIFSTHS